MKHSSDITKRFLKYVSFETTSSETSNTCPSSKKELKLGAWLQREFTKIGLSEPILDEFGYVYAYLPATPGHEGDVPIGLIAHMDTSCAVSGANIKPRELLYEGGDIPLGNGVTTAVSEFPFLNDYIGQKLIVTDGTTLLGADDKAGIAEIVTALETLIRHPEIPHGHIAVCITPDEEIGCGTDHFNRSLFRADYAYTVDGGTLGGIEYECFNAANARITVNGVNIHPGSAKNKMKNAVLIATEFISMLPPAETPAHTEGYEGFFHVGEISGNETLTQLAMLIRDHDRTRFEQRKAAVTDIADYLNKKYGPGTVCPDIRDSYYNMKEMILPVMYVVERAEQAYRAEGIEPIAVPIRGGTDGARLSFEGLPCPNLSTGGENYHGIHEFVSVDAMEKMVDVLISLCKA